MVIIKASTRLIFIIINTNQNGPASRASACYSKVHRVAVWRGEAAPGSVQCAGKRAQVSLLERQECLHPVGSLGSKVRLRPEPSPRHRPHRANKYLHLSGKIRRLSRALVEMSHSAWKPCAAVLRLLVLTPSGPTSPPHNPANQVTSRIVHVLTLAQATTREARWQEGEFLLI